MKNYMDFIEINPKIMFGKPVIKGTRITVESVLEDLGAGKMIDDIILSYPNLTKEAIWATLKFAAEAIKGERTYSLAL